MSRFYNTETPILQYILDVIIRDDAASLKLFLSYAIKLKKVNLIQKILDMHGSQSALQISALPAEYITAVEDARKFLTSPEKKCLLM